MRQRSITLEVNHLRGTGRVAEPRRRGIWSMARTSSSPSSCKHRCPWARSQLSSAGASSACPRASRRCGSMPGRGCQSCWGRQDSCCWSTAPCGSRSRSCWQSLSARGSRPSSSFWLLVGLATVLAEVAGWTLLSMAADRGRSGTGRAGRRTAAILAARADQILADSWDLAAHCADVLRYFGDHGAPVHRRAELAVASGLVAVPCLCASRSLLAGRRRHRGGRRLPGRSWPRATALLYCDIANAKRGPRSCAARRRCRGAAVRGRRARSGRHPTAAPAAQAPPDGQRGSAAWPAVTDPPSAGCAASS